jgi:hypothetical protein
MESTLMVSAVYAAGPPGHGRSAGQVPCGSCSQPQLPAAVEQHRHVLFRQAGATASWRYATVATA